MPCIKGGMESDVEEMDHETVDSDKTSNNEDSDSSLPSDTEDEDSFDMDEEDYEKRRSHCLEQMSDIEKQFVLLRDQLFEERTSQVITRLNEVRTGNAVEFVLPMKQLRDSMKARKEVAKVLKELNIVNIQHKFETEKQAALQNFESEKALLWDSIKSELEEKIRRLEEDRNSIDITSDLWIEQVNQRKNKKKTDYQTHEKRKKPVTVSGPFIIYMLQENDILEDWTTIRKALKSSKQNLEYDFSSEQRLSARFADGTLLYKGESFRQGSSVIIEEKNEPSYQAQVMSVNTSEVVLQKQDLTQRRIYISDLQSGKYGVRHSLACNSVCD